MARRRQHGEGSLYRRSSDGRWIAIVDTGWKNGKRTRRAFTGTTPEIALERRAVFLDRRRDGFTMPHGRQPYVSEWVTHWLHNVAKGKVEATTWHGSYRQKVEEHIVPHFERVPLAELDEERIEEWHRDLERKVSARTGRPLSAATITQCHRILARSLKAAVVRGRMPRNPCSNVTPPRIAREEARPPTSDEARLVLERCQTWPNGARWILAMATGMRQGEALALEWRDIRLDRDASVTIQRSAARVNGERVVKAPKSAKSTRSVSLPPVAVEALRRHRAAQVRNIGSDYVFTDATGAPVHPRQDWQDWQRLLADLGMPRYRVHDLRHGFATMLLEGGVDARVVQEIMGHASADFTRRAYQHVRQGLHEQAAGVIERALRGL